MVCEYTVGASESFLALTFRKRYLYMLSDWLRLGWSFRKALFSVLKNGLTALEVLFWQPEKNLTLCGTEVQLALI